jgi:hypothetical protein
MSNILDRIMGDVCLDERIGDGIFKMEETSHMDALRDYFIKKGITKEAAIHVTNRMTEGKHPERQVYRKEDGILVTFPSPQHKAKSMAKFPGKYVEKDPRPPSQQPEQEAPKQAPPGSKPEPGEVRADDKEETNIDDDEDDDIGGGNRKEPTIFQGDKQLEVEPSRDKNAPEPPPQPAQPAVPTAPMTPQRVAASKEIVRRILSTDDTTLSNIGGPLNVSENEQRHQLRELYKYADKLGYREAVKFLTPYIKP